MVNCATRLSPRYFGDYQDFLDWKCRIKCIYVKGNTDLSHGEKCQGSWGWGTGEERVGWGRAYLQKERRRRAPHTVNWAVGLGLLWKHIQFLLTRYHRKEMITKENVIAYGQESQNLVTLGATSSYRINSWPARNTDNRQEPQRPQGGVSQPIPYRWTSCQCNLPSGLTK